MTEKVGDVQLLSWRMAPRLRHPTPAVLELEHGSFQRTPRVENDKPRVYYRCRFIPDDGPYQGKQCEFRARSDSTTLGPLIRGKHVHFWTLQVFPAHPAGPPLRTRLIAEFSRFLCNTNLSLNQATRPHTRNFAIS